MKTHEEKVAEFALELSPVAPVPCGLEVGDVVTFTNEAGLKFGGYKGIGFKKEIDPEWRPHAFVYLDWASWWFPTSPDTLTKEV